MDAYQAKTLLFLERIAVALELLAAPPMEPPTTEPMCLHPIESRMDFGTTNGQADWQCGICGYRTIQSLGDR